MTGPADGEGAAPEPPGEPAAVVGTTPDVPAGLGGADLAERPTIGVGRDGRRLGWIELVVAAVKIESAGR